MVGTAAFAATNILTTSRGIVRGAVLVRLRPCNEFGDKPRPYPVIGHQAFPKRPAIAGRNRRGDRVGLGLDRVEQVMLEPLVRLHSFDEGAEREEMLGIAAGLCEPQEQGVGRSAAISAAGFSDCSAL